MNEPNRIMDLLGSTQLLFDNCEDYDFPEETHFRTGVIPTFHGFVWVFQDKTWVNLEFIAGGHSYTHQMNGRNFSDKKIAENAEELAQKAMRHANEHNYT